MKTITHLKQWLPVLAIAGIITVTGCKKETSSTAAADQLPPGEVAATVTAAADEAQSDAQFDDVFNITASVSEADAGEDIGLGTNVSGLAEMGTPMSPSTQRCFTVTVVPNIPGVFPKTVTIDFGNGCLGRDGKYRKGKIVSIFTNKMKVPGAKVSTTLVGYHVDSFHIEGTHITENTSTSNMQGLKIKVMEAKITNTISGRWRKWNSVKDVLQTEGNGTPHFPLDDVYRITGNSAGTNAAGHDWSSLVVEPLIKKFTCPWIVKGSLRLTRNGHQALLDYGNGTCDNLAILYINGVGHVITL